MKNDDPEKYPIGRFEAPASITERHITDWKNKLRVFPQRLSLLVGELTDEQLNTSYREGGWTIRQVIHHLADSHHHSYTRFKWALTEDKPLIKPYDEKAWAALTDAQSEPIDNSLLHLGIIHKKLTILLDSCSKVQLERSFIHPVGNVETSLKENIGRYVWHGNHHYTHIKKGLKRMEQITPSI